MGELLFNGEAHDRMRSTCGAVGLSPGLLKMLLHLSPEQPRPMRDLADHWGCDASYITAIVDGLEEQGIAERRSHPTDRRVKTVVLTEKGRQTQARVLDLLWEPPAAMSALTAAEQRQLRDLLRKMAAADGMLGRARDAAG
jgi:DNA-binding MarR family transcriptional regulator